MDMNLSNDTCLYPTKVEIDSLGIASPGQQGDCFPEEHRDDVAANIAFFDDYPEGYDVMSSKQPCSASHLAEPVDINVIR